VRGLPRLTITELSLLLRDATALSLALALPVGFLLVFGSMASGVALRDGPAGVQRGGPRASGEYFSVMAVFIPLGMLALFTIPAYLGTYREKGILRRLSVTPVRPAGLLVAQLAVHAAMALAGLAPLKPFQRLGHFPKHDDVGANCRTPTPLLCRRRPARLPGCPSVRRG
jgi:ABC-2 type transport system permease protein